MDVLRQMAESLIGMDVNRLAWSDLPLPHAREYDAFETAVYDLAGKMTQLPLCQLLGGAARDRVLVSAWSSHRTPDDAAQVASDALSAGMHHIKFKCSLEDDVVAWANSIYDKCAAGIDIVFDPNGRFGEVRHALRIGSALSEIGNVACLEDPLPRWDLEAHAELRKRSKLPIAIHIAMGYAEQGQRMEDLVRAIKLGAADIFNLSGSISQFDKLAAGADLAGIPYWHGSEIDLGVLEAAYVHSAASANGCTIASDIFGTSIREHDLLRAPLIFDGEWVTVPSGPGLGIEVDDDALAKYELRRVVIGD